MQVLAVKPILSKNNILGQRRKDKCLDIKKVTFME